MLRWPLLARHQSTNWVLKRWKHKRSSIGVQLMASNGIQPHVSCTLSHSTTLNMAVILLVPICAAGSLSQILARFCSPDTKGVQTCLCAELQETAIVRQLPQNDDISITIVLAGQQRFMSRHAIGPSMLYPFELKCLPSSVSM